MYASIRIPAKLPTSKMEVEHQLRQLDKVSELWPGRSMQHLAVQQ